ncbi:MAG: nucleotidyltransferase family protein [Armatimonadota bacterium]
MKSLREWKDTLAQHKPELAEKYSVKEIGIFGSYARGEQTEEEELREQILQEAIIISYCYL